MLWSNVLHSDILVSHALDFHVLCTYKTRPSMLHNHPFKGLDLPTCKMGLFLKHFLMPPTSDSRRSQWESNRGQEGKAQCTVEHSAQLNSSFNELSLLLCTWIVDSCGLSCPQQKIGCTLKVTPVDSSCRWSNTQQKIQLNSTGNCSWVFHCALDLTVHNLSCSHKCKLLHNTQRSINLSIKHVKSRKMSLLLLLLFGNRHDHLTAIHPRQPRWAGIKTLRNINPIHHLHWAEPGGTGPWRGWLTIVLQCCDSVGWVMWPVK